MSLRSASSDAQRKRIGELSVKEWLEISFRRSVRIELEEQIFADRGREIKPLMDACRRGKIIARNLSGFETRNESIAEAQAKGTCDHE